MTPTIAMLASLTPIALAGAGSYAALHRNSNLFGRVLSRLPGDGLRVALTFDDGPNVWATPRILDTLAEYDVPATFFLLGRHAERWPALVRRIVAEGHQVANHGFAHRRLHLAGPNRATADLSAGTRAIVDACGVAPRHFRAPHGFRSPFVAPAAHRLGQRCVGWSLGVWDSGRPGVHEIARRTVGGVRGGSIVLLHDGDGYDPLGDRTQTAGALARIVPELLARGYAFEGLPV
ncbi:MAG: polysaccharide deacetylase family protein [Gemmatimonadaceae bacterium]|nr:polysaccharide deacetylase family protein [Gemmatimonadaceae bacterium]